LRDLAPVQVGEATPRWSLNFCLADLHATVRSVAWRIDAAKEISGDSGSHTPEIHPTSVSNSG
jgi:hypothetical protein